MLEGQQAGLRWSTILKKMDALDKAYVKVEWQHLNGADRVLLFSDRDS